VRGGQVPRQEGPEQLHGVRWWQGAAVDEFDSVRRLRGGHLPAVHGADELRVVQRWDLQRCWVHELLGLRDGQLLFLRSIVLLTLRGRHVQRVGGIDLQRVRSGQVQ
jgi:hypothetical protein